MSIEDNNTQDPKGNPQYPNAEAQTENDMFFAEVLESGRELPDPKGLEEGTKLYKGSKLYEIENGDWVIIPIPFEFKDKNVSVNKPDYAAIALQKDELPHPDNFVEGYKPRVWERRLRDWFLLHPNPTTETTEPELTEADFPNEKPDVGILARDLMEKKAEVKRLKRRRLLDRCIFWLVMIGIVGVMGFFLYNLVLSNYETGRYNDVRECKISAANLTVTGKRTYSYPFKSLFGFRLIDESRVIEKTTVNVAGAAMTVMGLTDKRWWGIRIGQGDRNVQNLRQADTYTFATDKGLAVTTYRGFCQQKEQVVETDPKTQDSAIID